MIDPRFANAGAVPLVPGYGAQQIPAQYRHHKHKVRNDASPVSLDESIHKVDHSQPQYFQSIHLDLNLMRKNILVHL
jgi:hypothetical protein